MISILLQQLGYSDISLARNGIEALTQLTKDRCDLILSDWSMPEMDGLALLGKIREDGALKNIPFVFITAMNEIGMVKRALSEGVTDYITKPITLQTLVTKVAAALKGHQKRP
jgi:CheY-like chemotaxis protein